MDGQAQPGRGMPNCGYTRGLPEQTHCAAQLALLELRSRIGTAASRDAVMDSNKGGSHPLGKPDGTTNGWRPQPNPGPACSGWSSTNEKRPDALFAISGPGTQRSRVAASTMSRLSHPVPLRLPRRTAKPRGGLLLLHTLLQRPARKRPLPCRERALTCGN